MILRSYSIKHHLCKWIYVYTYVSIHSISGIVAEFMFLDRGFEPLVRARVCTAPDLASLANDVLRPRHLGV